METPVQTAAIPHPPTEELFEHLRHRLERQVRAQRIPAQDADDLVQQTLIALFDQYEEVRDPERWAVGVLRKHCLMYWRSRRRRIYDSVDDTVLEWLAAPEVPSQERRDLKSDLATAMDRLPDHYRSVIRLRYGLGMEPAEVAAELGYRASSIGKVTLRSLAAMNRAMIACGYCDGPPVR
jgi:RNA polymerase sigma-70 factor (ECF subfamily)